MNYYRPFICIRSNEEFASIQIIILTSKRMSVSSSWKYSPEVHYMVPGSGKAAISAEYLYSDHIIYRPHLDTLKVDGATNNNYSFTTGVAQDCLKQTLVCGHPARSIWTAYKVCFHRSGVPLYYQNPER